MHLLPKFTTTANQQNLFFIFLPIPFAFEVGEFLKETSISMVHLFL